MKSAKLMSMSTNMSMILFQMDFTHHQAGTMNAAIVVIKLAQKKLTETNPPTGGNRGVGDEISGIQR